MGSWMLITGPGAFWLHMMHRIATRLALHLFQGPVVLWPKGWWMLITVPGAFWLHMMNTITTGLASLLFQEPEVYWPRRPALWMNSVEVLVVQQLHVASAPKSCSRASTTF